MCVCVRGEGVQGVLTLICGGVAQTCHDDRVVELKEQLVVEEVDGEGQEGKGRRERSSQKERAISITLDGIRKSMSASFTIIDS